MRPGQQSKRSRGRGNNNGFNRKGANPLTRTFDSSGPDVKIRGTAQHIAEKYMSLARDAQGSGDRVMAENYLQHAEHYNRIISAAQAQMQERYQRDERADNGSDGADDNAQTRGNNQASSDRRNDEQDDGASFNDQRVIDADGPQPEIDGVPAEVAAETADGQDVSKPRRRSATGSRPRRTKRVAAEAGADEAQADEGGENATEVAAEEAPKKPARRRRAPKAKADEGSGDQPELADASSD